MGGEVTCRAITIEGCSEQGLVIEAKLGGDELAFVGGYDLKVGDVEMLVY